MPMHVNTCPVCGAQFASLTPGDVCSARCSAEQRRRSAMGKRVPDAEPRYRSGGATERRGRSGGPGPVPAGRKNCLVLAVALAGGAAVVAAGAGTLVAELIRHLA